MGRLAKLHEAYAGTGVNFLGVCIDVASPDGSTADEARYHIDSVGAEYTVITPASSLTKGLSYIPSTHIYDSSGNLLAKYVGSLEAQDWINIIETLME